MITARSAVLPFVVKSSCRRRIFIKSTYSAGVCTSSNENPSSHFETLKRFSGTPQLFQTSKRFSGTTPQLFQTSKIFLENNRRLFHTTMKTPKFMPAQLPVTFHRESPESDPAENAVLFLGRQEHITQMAWDDYMHKLEPRVPLITWEAMKKLVKGDESGGHDSVQLYLNHATVNVIPSKASRHNAPSRPHAVTKMVRNFTYRKRKETIIVLCNRADIYPIACAISRAFPLYMRKTDIGGDTNDPEKSGYNEKRVEFRVMDSPDGKISEKELENLQAAQYGIQMSGKIVDTPCRDMNTLHFVDVVKEVAQELGTKPPTLIVGKELEEKGFGGIWGVGKGAMDSSPPVLAVLSHEPEGATETVAWVGKGIVYDTGGLSMKGKLGMVGMKRDCGGAAGILGAFYATVKAGFKQNLHAVFCLAENAVSNLAAKPDDIHTMYSGKTVEINNTDAEGRLVVGDGVYYARKDLKADYVLDMCTLTGAQGVTTGKHHAGTLTNREDWEDFCFQAGRSSGDLTFPMVYAPEMHFSEFNSVLADMKNSVGDRSNATASCAGLFINSHLGFDYPGVWVHVDMAYPVHCGERASGYGIALLSTLFGKFSDSELLSEIGPEICGVKKQNGKNGNGHHEEKPEAKRQKTE